MGNTFESQSIDTHGYQQIPHNPKLRFLSNTVGVTEFERNLEVSKKVWSGEDVDRHVVTGGLMITEKEMDQIWHLYDTSGDGQMDLEEGERFLKDLLSVLEKRERHNCRNSIEALKIKKDMYTRNGWDYQQAGQNLKEYQRHLPGIFKSFNDNISQFLSQLDSNGDGIIAYDDFLTFCKQFNVNEQRKILYGLLPSESQSTSS